MRDEKNKEIVAKKERRKKNREAHQKEREKEKGVITKEREEKRGYRRRISVFGNQCCLNLAAVIVLWSTVSAVV